MSMWTLRTWAKLRLDSRSLAGKISNRRRLLAVFVLLCLVFAVSLPIQADSAIQVLSQGQSSQFSKSLTFSLEAKSDSRIVEAILFYGLQASPLVRRIYPDMQPGQAIKVTYVEQLEPGQFAPGVTMRYWWKLENETGSILDTEEQTFQYQDERFDWQSLAGQRVDLFWYGSAQSRAQVLVDKADQAVNRLEQQIGVPVEQRVKIYVYNSSKDMASALAQRSSGYDDRVTTLGVSVGENTLLLLGSNRDADTVVAHELSHVVVGIATDNPYTGLPRWLDEGLAMYAEGALPRENSVALQKGIQEGTLLSVRSMTSYSGQASQVDLFYGEAYSLVSFMIDEFGTAKMQQLLAVFAQGELQEQALQQVYGFGIDQLDNIWRGSLGLGGAR